MEAVARGEILRLLMNVPPGTMKSLLVSVFFPAWVWTKDPSKRFLATSHNQENAVRDSLKCRRLVESEWYQNLWGDKVVLTGDQNAKTKFENTATGFRQAAPFTSMTGLRADYVILDDPMSVDDAISDVTRESINLTFRESLPTRLNNPDSSAIIVIMQRLHDDDTSGVIIKGDYGYEHVCLPMRYDWARPPTSIGFRDPRTEDGELLFPERFPEWVVDRDEQIMGPIATAGQMQQSPIPRGGSILKREYWQLWEEEQTPAFEFVLVSCDTAYSKDQENDPSAVAVLGVFRDKHERPRVMLIWGWAKHCELHGQVLEKGPQETKKAYDQRSMPTWGLVEWIAYTCRRFRADRLLIENKASGKDVANEMRRLYGEDQWLVQLVEPNRDKVTRAHAVEPTFAAGYVFAPDTDWAEKFIEECEVFPKGKHDDRVDALTQGLKFLRENGLIQHNFELAAEYREAAAHRAPVKALYDV
jgi:predicted phage terminase large subunit-like protein